MKRLLSILIAMLMVVGLFAVVSSAEEELPEGTILLDYAGYVHDAYFVILAGDNMTIGELTALGIGAEKDMNYFAIAVVDEYDTIIEINMTLGRPDGIKTDTVCPENGYIIGLNGGKEGYEVLADAHVGDIIELVNIDMDDYRGKEGSVKLENAGFIIHDESGDSEYYLTLPITAENGVAVDADTDEVLRDGQIYYFPGEADAERVVDSEEFNLRYSYLMICDADGYVVAAGNNLVFASQDTNFQNEMTIPAGGYAFTFFYNASDATANEELYSVYTTVTGGLQIYNETLSFSDKTYKLVKDGDYLAVIQCEVEEESSEEESSEAEDESSAPAESSEVEEESSKAEESKENSTAASTAPTTSSDAEEADGGSLGIIIGIIVAVVAIAVIVVVIVIKRKN